MESLKADPALTAFSFDGPYPVRDMADLLDNLYCMDNGRYYETPVDFTDWLKLRARAPGMSRRCISNVMCSPAVLSRTNCSIARPFPRLRWTGSRLAMPISNCRVIVWAARFPSNTLFAKYTRRGEHRSSINTGLSGAGKKSTRSNQERFVTF